MVCLVPCDAVGEMQSQLGRHLSSREERLTKDGEIYLEYDLTKSTAMQLGPLLIRAGPSGVSGNMQRVVMHRKGAGAFAVPRFGIFEGLLRHTGPDGVQNLLARVRWHKTCRAMHHHEIEAPIAMVSVDKTVPDLCLAEDLVPFSCFSAPDPEFSDSQLIILSVKPWNSCLSLLGFPKIVLKPMA